MGGFCNAPLAGYARIGDDTGITVQAVAFTRDGSLMIDGRHTGSDAEETAKAVCRHLTRRRPRTEPRYMIPDRAARDGARPPAT
ncbi:hypothetical protein ACFRFJ_19465 [Streptomyces hydrogenans]|uniref:hypothetical protein n=1 Tax=Streptomyces hydrogenans TaxID=1873719 RepID=UPI00368C9B22